MRTSATVGSPASDGLPAEPSAPTPAGRRAPGPLGAAGLFLAVAGVLAVVVTVSAAWLPLTSHPGLPAPGHSRPWIDGWSRWDGQDYLVIARHGYVYTRGVGGNVAWFPAYPLLVRLGGRVTGDDALAGMVLTFAAGLGAVLLFARWLRTRLDPAAAWAAIALLVAYPYASYLIGAVYSDALFLAAAIGAFVLLEHDRPVLAGLAGAVATATRPVGPALVLGLAVRALERRGAFEGGWSLRRVARAARPRDAGVLLSVLGAVAFAGYLWSRFGDGLAFVHVQSAWNQSPGLDTWLKLSFFADLRQIHDLPHLAVYVAHPVVTVVALAFVPLVRRRFGWGYAVYALGVLGLGILGTKNFFSMGRYALAAFPVFAAAGDWLARRPRALAGTLVLSAVSLVAITSFVARNYYVA